MYPHLGFGFGFSGFGLLLVILFGALIVIGIALLIRRPAPPPAATPPVDQRSQAQRILEERFARGEIDEAEFRARLEVLLGATAMAGSPGTPMVERAWTPVAPPAAPAPAALAMPSTARPADRPTPPVAGVDGGEDQ